MGKIIFSLLSLIFAFSITANCQGKILFTKIDTSYLPIGMKYEGKIKNAIRWKDLDGDNIVIASESGLHPTRSVPRGNDTDRDAELYAYHYVLKESLFKNTWRVFDFVKDCDLDMQVNFIKNTLQVTDLNNDGYGEIWFMYKTGCFGGVNGIRMKLIMYQGEMKYEMIGRNKVRYSDSQTDGGEYRFDYNFLNSPKVFQDFAIQLWQKNIMQTDD